jgi:hypothetical protein
MPEDWDRPFPFGFPAAIESAGSVAAPLLAGFSFALVGLIIPAPEHFRWASGALTLLLAGAAAFIAAVQCSFWARQYAITPEDIELWRPEYPAERKAALQRLHRRGFAIWARRFNASYRTGILLLLAGVTAALVPPGTIGAGRWIAIAVAAAGFLGELAWVLATWLLRGSPVTAYNSQPDEAPDEVAALWLRRSPALRRLARLFVPLVRIEVTLTQRPGPEGRGEPLPGGQKQAGSGERRHI